MTVAVDARLELGFFVCKLPVYRSLDLASLLEDLWDRIEVTICPRISGAN